MVTLLAFELQGCRFALPALTVVETVRAVAITALPRAPAIIEGVVNYRGTLAPVLDLRQRFGLPAVPLAPEQHFLIARTRKRMVALRVDRALGLVTAEESDIHPTDRVAPGAEYVAGIARLADGLLIINDLERFLSLDEADQVEAAMTGPAG